MILEGFEIEDWSCIKRVAVSDLPPTGVIVLHGPNGTGKSSILEALRAGLMDKKSTSKALGRGYSGNGSEKPRLSVTFRANGQSWRVTKQFNSKESKLESRTPSGAWKLETADASEAHERTRQLTGGVDSTLGLHQLLWLTQAEFHLPDPRQFDAGVQSQLRGVLGVLQTPLDDRFLARIKEGWSRWYSVRSKPGERPKLKKDCPLDKAQAELQRRREELAGIEREFRDFEAMMEQSSRLDIRTRDLQRQRDERARQRDILHGEYERSRDRLNAHRQAADRVQAAENELSERREIRRRREEVDRRVREAEQAATAAGREVEEAGRRLGLAERRVADLDAEIKALRARGRERQDRLDELGERRQRSMLREQVASARARLQDAERLACGLVALENGECEGPSPDDATLRELEENRAKASRLRADLDASAITLTIHPDASTPAARLAIDNAAEVEANGDRIARMVRRRATIVIPGWGRVELARGPDARSLDQIESDLRELERGFARAVAPFGIEPEDPAGLDRLRALAANRKAREPEVRRRRDELARLAPQGLEALRAEVARLEGRLAGEPSAGDDPAELDRLAAQGKAEVATIEEAIASRQGEMDRLRVQIEGDPRSPGLRRRDAAARERLATLNASARFLGDERERMPSIEQSDLQIKDAESSLARAREALAAARLTDGEGTIHERLSAADEALRGLDERIADARRELHRIEGALRLSEGLHQKRAAAAARVEELSRQTEREGLESLAYDRLYGLFEECREKQLGDVMGPIHDRVVRWMNTLRIGGYRAIRFNDQFLPETLIGGDGATELTMGDESTGTIEQIALMVRLALGSALATPEEPVVAMLDDPLTHSDVVRLDRMRGVLKSAAVGDPLSNPPAGPLQVVIFTCHPEWFAIDGARTIDLSDPRVLARRD